MNTNKPVSTVYLGLGTNLGDREKQLSTALDLLERDGVRILRRSSVYETEPVELREQPWFLNLVVEAETTFTPRELLRHSLAIERDMGRERVTRNGPRIIDIDVLFYRDAIFETPDLQIPHPRMADRRFVLAPLAELAPDLVHPTTGTTIQKMLETLQDPHVVQRSDSR